MIADRSGLISYPPLHPSMISENIQWIRVSLANDVGVKWIASRYTSIHARARSEMRTS
jgi:hypothetical protein